VAGVGEAIAQIDNATQENAALVEEATAAARSLQEQSSILTEKVNVFRLTGAAGVARAPGRSGAVAAAGANDGETEWTRRRLAGARGG
jgi:hypothetical protein